MGRSFILMDQSSFYDVFQDFFLPLFQEVDVEIAQVPWKEYHTLTHISKVDWESVLVGGVGRPVDSHMAADFICVMVDDTH